MSGKISNSYDLDISPKEVKQQQPEEEATHILREQNSHVGKKCIQNSLPEIFKLNIDCFHEIFEWLSLNDLLSIAQTCTWLQQVAGDFYRSYYVSKRIIAEGGGYALYRDLNIFTPYIEKISISGNNLNVYHFVGVKCKSIREIRLGNCLSENAIECMKNILKKVEVIEINECIIRQSFYESFLKYCLKLKNLSVKRSYKIRNKSIIIGSDNEWLLQKYPLLEHIELTELYKIEENKLKTFFNVNPNICSFSTDAETIWENRESLLSSNIKLEKLAIEFTNLNLSEPVNDLLRQLYENFYRKLHIYFRFDPQAILERILSMPFSTSIESLHFEFSWLAMRNSLINHIDISLKNVKILSINKANKIANIENLPTKLPNLEKLYFGEANPEEIWPFVCGSVRLKTFKVLNMVHSDGIYSFTEFPDVKKMNEKRKILKGARKVTIYISDRLILVSKWAKKATNLDFIELRRFESLEWNDLNSHFRHNHSNYF